MAIPAVLLKRLEVLERSFDLDGSNVIKVFAFHPEEDVPYWDPEPPEAWKEIHPKGKSVLLEIRNMGVHNK